MKAHVLLGCMLLSYLAVIYLIYSNYRGSESKSVSCILGDDACNGPILFFMVLMGLFTVLYEMERGCYKCVGIIVGLLLSIYGLLCYDTSKTIHYAFAAGAFLFILLFMGLNAKDRFLQVLFGIEIIFLLLLLGGKCFFFIEAVLILNFAVYYLYLHYITYVK